MYISVDLRKILIQFARQIIMLGERQCLIDSQAMTGVLIKQATRMFQIRTRESDKPKLYSVAFSGRQHLSW